MKRWPKELWVGRYHLGGDVRADDGYALETKPKKRKRRKAGKNK